MAKNVKYEPGWSLDLTCTKPDKPNSGDPVRIGNLTGIALTDEDAAGKTVVNTGPFVAKFSVKDNGGTGIAIGAPIWYHDDANPALNNVSADGYYYGIALEAISDNQTATIQVYHDCAPGGAGTLSMGQHQRDEPHRGCGYRRQALYCGEQSPDHRSARDCE